MNQFRPTIFRVASSPAMIFTAKTPVLALVAIASILFAPAKAAILSTDGSRADVQTKINSAVDGDIIAMPAGSFNWTSGVIISGKAIHLKGAGAGRIVARSSTPVPIGTGTKTFTLASESIPAIESLKSALTNGAILRVEEMCNVANYMVGTVTSLNGSTLTMNITSSGGSGTPGIWILSTGSSTVITHNAGSDTLLYTLEDTSGSVEISGIKFIYGTGSGNTIIHRAVANGKPILVHDCWVSVRNSGLSVIRVSANRGVFFNCSFDSSPFAMAAIAFQLKDDNNTDPSASGSWERASTMGTADTDGTKNLYIEACDFHGFLNSGDTDDNSRLVVRYSLFNNAGFGSHGAESSYFGTRHYEFYNNEFAFNNLGDRTFNINHWLYLRGGTGVITDNIMPNILSMAYGDKPEVRINVQNLQRTSPGWGEGVSGVQYPYPRQVGLGYVTGTGVDGMGNRTYQSVYVGDSEPLYQWNNTAGGSYASPSLQNYTPPTTLQDDIVDYVKIGRDYINGPKPGYSKYSYPHPLRGQPRFVQITVVQQP